MTTAYLGVSKTDAALFHLLSLPDDVELEAVPGFADTLLDTYPPEYAEVAWVASDDTATAELLAGHYGVKARKVPPPLPSRTVPAEEALA